jgi:hypothetical protein
MTDTEAQAKAAVALFKKEERAREGKEAMADYQAEGIAVRKRIVRLRALRLAQPSVEAKKPKPVVERVKRPKRYG